MLQSHGRGKTEREGGWELNSATLHIQEPAKETEEERPQTGHRTHQSGGPAAAEGLTLPLDFTSWTLVTDLGKWSD